MVAVNVGKQGNREIQNVGNQTVGYNARQNGNLTVRNLQGNVAAQVVKNYRNGKNVTQIRCDNCMGLGHYARNYINKTRVRDSTYYTERLMLVQQEEVGIPLLGFHFM
nr:hypothetical protein [Tanacetum cinerariifolium]